MPIPLSFDRESSYAPILCNEDKKKLVSLGQRIDALLQDASPHLSDVECRIEEYHAFANTVGISVRERNEQHKLTEFSEILWGVIRRLQDARMAAAEIRNFERRVA